MTSDIALNSEPLFGNHGVLDALWSLFVVYQKLSCKSTIAIFLRQKNGTNIYHFVLACVISFIAHMYAENGINKLHGTD